MVPAALRRERPWALVARILLAAACWPITQGTITDANSTVFNHALHSKYYFSPQSMMGTKYRQSMLNFGDVQYIAYVTIGTQIVSGILDTGSFELVVFSNKCVSCGRAALYDSSSSPSHQAGKLASGQSYGSGDTYSVEATDEILIGSKRLNQTFWEVQDAHMPILGHAAFQSIIGIGPPETPAADAWAAAKLAARNVTMALSKGKTVSANLRKTVTEKVTIAQEMSRRSTLLQTFGVQFFTICVGSSPGSDGFFVWNDTSALERPNIFTRIQVVGKHTWSVKMMNAMLEEKPSGAKKLAQFGQSSKHFLGCSAKKNEADWDGCSALIDSGTSLLAMPGPVINKLLVAMENTGANCSKMEDLPDLVFHMGGQRFSLPADAYVSELTGVVPNYLQSLVRFRNVGEEVATKTGTAGSGQCQLIVMESYADSKFGPLWILGVPFFRRYYTTFNVGKTKGDRSLYVAQANEECQPVPHGSRSAAAPPSSPRQIDPSKLYVPQAVQTAVTKRFVNI